MLLLSTATALLQVVTGGTQILHVHASWVDASGATVTPTGQNTIVSSATTATIVASPPANTQRNVKSLWLQNTDATNSLTITVQHVDGQTQSTTVNIYKATLPAGWSAVYDDARGWGTVDASGGRVETPLVGRFLGSTVLTSASGTFTTRSQTNTIKIRGVGGGGGGAGCTSVASAASFGGGGGSGAYLEKVITATPNTGYAYTCGAAGVGVSGAAGGNGGNSTFTVGATTYTATLGSGAPIATAVATVGTSYLGGTGGIVATNGDLNSTGQNGEPGIMTAITPLGVSGNGGSSPFGAGGIGRTSVGNGNAAGGFGAGGGGAATGASTVRTGGSGTGGCWIVDEYS